MRKFNRKCAKALLQGTLEFLKILFIINVIFCSTQICEPCRRILMNRLSITNKLVFLQTKKFRKTIV